MAAADETDEPLPDWLAELPAADGPIDADVRDIGPEQVVIAVEMGALATLVAIPRPVRLADCQTVFAGELAEALYEAAEVAVADAVKYSVEGSP